MLQEQLEEHGDVRVMLDVDPNEGPCWDEPTFVMYRDWETREDIFKPTVYEDGKRITVSEFVTLE